MKIYAECQNSNCPDYLKRKLIDKEEPFCPLCGEKFVHICKGCGTIIEDDKRKYCKRCMAKRRSITNGIVGAAASVGMAAVSIVTKGRVSLKK